MGYHDISQVCMNGHVITRNARRSPEFTKKFCDKCGEPTIMACEACNEPIQGEYHVEGVAYLGFSDPPPPNFCHACGKPYPWTARRIDTAKALAEEFDELSKEDREKLKQSLEDLYRDSPQSEVAAVRFKKIMAKVGKESYGAMKQIVISVLSEVAKKSIFGG